MTLSLEKLPTQIKFDDWYMRLLTPEDSKAFYEMTNASEIGNIISFLSYPVDPTFPEQWIAKNKSITERVYGIFSGQTLIGNIGAHLNEAMDVEIGYWVNPQHGGKGIASRSVNCLKETLKLLYPDATIFAECLPTNTASLRVLEKNGFIRTDKPSHRGNRIRLEIQR